MSFDAPEIEEAAILVDDCLACGHITGDHMFYLGPVKFCMAYGCACGRRSLARFTLSSAPWWPVLAAAALLAFHLTKWAFLGFRVVSQ